MNILKINNTDEANVRKALKNGKTFIVNVTDGISYEITLTFNEQIITLTTIDYWGAGHDFYNSDNGHEDIIEFLK